MCLVRSEFPSGTVLPWQNCCFLPLHCLLEMRKNKKAKDSKRRVEGLPGKFPGTNNVQITASETDRCYREWCRTHRAGSWLERGLCSRCKQQVTLQICSQVLLATIAGNRDVCAVGGLKGTLAKAVNMQVNVKASPLGH